MVGRMVATRCHTQIENKRMNIEVMHMLNDASLHHDTRIHKASERKSG